MQENYEGCYGPVLSISEIKEKIINAFISDTQAETLHPGERFSTVIWGRAGIGKTSIIRQLEQTKVEYRDKTYPGFKIVYLPLADIEEVGDIVGMPERHLCVEKKGIQKWIPENCLDTYTSKLGYSLVEDKSVKQFTAAPEWVPVPDSEGYCEPTIILVDDFNRANLRVLKACMPLFQTYSTLGWKLPKGCHLVLTGNPCLQDYQVTDIDTAVLTRMRHITARFEIKDWINWVADVACLDTNLIGFCSYYPEMMFGKTLTNPRTIVEAFRMLKYSGIPTDGIKSDKDIQNVKTVLEMLLDKEFVDAFISYIVSDDHVFVCPEELFENPEESRKKIKSLLSGNKRLDIISILASRLFGYIMSGKAVCTEKNIKTFNSFLFNCDIPNDIIMDLLLKMNEPQNICSCITWMDSPRISGIMSEFYSN